MKFAVLEFPGSNCDHDCVWTLESVLKQKVDLVWHQNSSLPKGTDVIMVPGGFSYGDYLRCGAIARFSPIMKAVQAHAKRGGYVWGICNGFQILTEAGLLPGALVRNASLSFLCQDVFLRVENSTTDFTAESLKRVIRIPIAHGEGNYSANEETLRQLNDEGRVVFRYCDEAGELNDASNPNGSSENIAGILSENGRVLGMMPHPERASEDALGNTDGKALFESVLSALGRRGA